MEITLLVAPGGSITFHCEDPFYHKLISLDEVESTILSLMEIRKDEENESERNRSSEVEST